ncbi:MAG: toll/interleukin-1 receptor domain-containing protein [Gammaproteobacteria bacterium]|nr:toll/interleukin-1 receptor domain-containing protein [Gammaproteobacteria bacterium]MDH5650631.1 toll/interleukin-1 receptor domain-containing protein [Gammaproteobacteria bacterium]
MKPRPSVFICHSSGDNALAIDLAQSLRIDGMGVWLDSERIKYGQAISRAIELGLNHADYILLLVTESYLNEGWCRREYEPLLAGVVREGKDRIISVLVDDCELPEALRDCTCFTAVSQQPHPADRISISNAGQLAGQIGEKRDRYTDFNTSLLNVISSDLSPSRRLLSALELFHPDGLYYLSPESVSGGAAAGFLESLIRVIAQLEIQYQDLAMIFSFAGYGAAIYGSAHKVAPENILQVNRRCVAVSNQLRNEYQLIVENVPLSIPISTVLDSVTKPCLQIVVEQNFLAVELIENQRGLSFSDEIQRARLSGPGTQRKFTDFDDWGTNNGGKELIDLYNHVLVALNDCKIALYEGCLV